MSAKVSLSLTMDMTGRTMQSPADLEKKERRRQLHLQYRAVLGRRLDDNGPKGNEKSRSRSTSSAEYV
jgi:hypothetical protein